MEDRRRGSARLRSRDTKCASPPTWLSGVVNARKPNTYFPLQYHSEAYRFRTVDPDSTRPIARVENARVQTSGIISRLLFSWGVAKINGNGYCKPLHSDAALKYAWLKIRCWRRSGVGVMSIRNLVLCTTFAGA